MADKEQTVDDLEAEFNQGGVDNWDNEAWEQRMKRTNEASAVIGKYLLQSWTMLAETCPVCLSPLMSFRNCQPKCVVCENDKNKEQNSNDNNKLKDKAISIVKEEEQPGLQLKTELKDEKNNDSNNNNNNNNNNNSSKEYTQYGLLSPMSMKYGVSGYEEDREDTTVNECKDTNNTTNNKISNKNSKIAKNSKNASHTNNSNNNKTKSARTNPSATATFPRSRDRDRDRDRDRNGLSHIKSRIKNFHDSRDWSPQSPQMHNVGFGRNRNRNYPSHNHHSHSHTGHSHSHGHGHSHGHSHNRNENDHINVNMKERHMYNQNQYNYNNNNNEPSYTRSELINSSLDRSIANVLQKMDVLNLKMENENNNNGNNGNNDNDNDSSVDDIRALKECVEFLDYAINVQNRVNGNVSPPQSQMPMQSQYYGYNMPPRRGMYPFNPYY